MADRFTKNLALKLKLSDFDYNLPPENIAQKPLAERDTSRLLILNRESGDISHAIFSELPTYLNPGDVLVLNDTRVTAQRLFGARQGYPNEHVETFLTHRIEDGLWQALVRPGKKLLPGVKVDFGNELSADVVERLDDRGGRLLRFSSNGTEDIEAAIARYGSAPLPPYITEPLETQNRGRYQTVYASYDGSAAAPTAGLHFTEGLLDQIKARGVIVAYVTLHVGLGTFRPIETEDITDHKMHAEQVQLTQQTADIINSAKGRIIAVGTTSARTLESAAIGKGCVAPLKGETSLYVTPGKEFQIVDALITNFHMPRSTLMVLVSAFAGREAIMHAYQTALKENYRFLSFGDAMFIC